MGRNRKNRKTKKDTTEHSLPWERHGDCVVDAAGKIVKAPHHCSWEGDDYADNEAAADMIVTAVNNYYGQR